MPSLSGGGGGLKMECPIKFLLGMELISVQMMADHWLFKSFLGGTLHIKGVGMHWKFWIKPLKETDLGVAQAFFDLKETKKYTYQIYIFMLFRVQP